MKSKILVGIMTVSLLGGSLSVHAQTTAELQTQIASLLQPLSPLQERLASLISSEPCTDGSCDMHYVVSAMCGGLPDRHANVWESSPSGTPVGALVFSTGGGGIGRYSDQQYRNETVDRMVSEGYQVYEVDWNTPQNSNGWFVNGAGYKNSACAYANVVKYIHKNLADTPSLMCSQGNSGGSFQNAYGFSNYGLEKIFDLTILSGGPPIPDVESFCFTGIPHNDEGWERTDTVMGWEGNGDYCKNGVGPRWAHRAADKTSLVTELETLRRDFTYPNTKVYLLGSENDPYAESAREEYYPLIMTEKESVVLPGDTHAIDETAIGSAMIQEIFLAEC